MNHRIKARIGAFLTAAAIAVLAAASPASAVYNTSDRTQGEAFMPAAQTYWKYCEQYKFPAGKYWNSGNPDTYTSSACYNHYNNNTSDCTHVFAGKSVSAGYYNGNSQNPLYQQLYYCQCAGFARKLAQDFFGGANVWMSKAYSSGEQLRFGDQLRINNDSHSIFITEVNGNSVKFADCNWDNHCGIRWDVSATVSNGRLYFGGRSYRIDRVERPVMAGDVTGDSRITFDDVYLIWAISTNHYSYAGKDSQVIREAADLNNDGQVTSADYSIAYSQYDGSGYYRNQKFLRDISEWPWV